MDKYREQLCKTHGVTSYVLGSNGRYRCRKCRSAAVSKRRRVIKTKAVEYKGGRCQRCGYDKCIAALDFHHLHGKDFTISSDGKTFSWEKVKIELDKCVLLCANCHREVHAEEHISV